MVTHAWHMPRSQEAFTRAGLPTLAAPVRLDRLPRWEAREFMPRPDRLAQSWYALREWAGRLVYALRDGGPPPLSRFSHPSRAAPAASA
ncbi:YdcF family protein [Siccirubricoccus deserti]